MKTDLAVIETITAEIVFVPGGVNTILQKIEALVAAGLSDEAAKAAITAIAQGQVPHTRISY